MLRATLLFLNLVIATFLVAQAQIKTADCLKEKLITATPETLNTLTDHLAKMLPEKTFYMIGESHTFLANNDLQFELIRSLHAQGVFNVVNELPHATCFLYNQYLETGDEAILKDLRPAATYSLLKKVRTYNQSLPENEQVRYYGLDYLDSKDGPYNLYRTLSVIRKNTTDKSLPLDTLISYYLKKDSIILSDAKLLIPQLNKALTTEEERYRSHFGRYYDDLLLISSNMLENRTNRDKSIYESFTVLYRLLAAKQTRTPKFLSFYGIGHLENFGAMLQENDRSPVKQSVAKIGLHYINCWAGWTTPGITTTGLFKIEKKNLAELIAYCETQTWQAALLPGSDCLSLKKGTSLDAVFIFNRYGSRKMNSWKFD